ncbi:MAG: DUF4199 domain-containing protein [Bacteroidota bacterium]
MKKIIIPGMMLAAYTGLIIILQINQLLPEGRSSLLFIPVHFIVFFFLLKWVKAKFYSNDITFKAVFTNGVLIGVFSTVVVSTCFFVFLRYVDPSAMETIKKLSEEKKQKLIEKLGSLSASMEKSLEEELTPARQAIQTFSVLILWILFSLISAAILKKKL